MSREEEEAQIKWLADVVAGSIALFVPRPRECEQRALQVAQDLWANGVRAPMAGYVPEDGKNDLNDAFARGEKVDR